MQLLVHSEKVFKMFKDAEGVEGVYLYKHLKGEHTCEDVVKITQNLQIEIEKHGVGLQHWGW